MYNENLKAQYVIMTDENKNNEGSYVPNYDELTAQAPNVEMMTKWIQSRDIHAELEGKFGGFAFNSIYMIKMSCGHYEIFQHSARDEDDLLEWIELMQSDKYYKDCTMCICGGA